MRKQILTWNEDTKTYSVRYASNEEIQRINLAIKKMGELKYLYNMIERDAFQSGVAVDYYIDCDAWSTYCYTCNLAKEIRELSEGLISLNPSEYVHYA